MWDVVMVGLGIVMFVILFGYVWACDRLRDLQDGRAGSNDREETRR